MGAGQGTGQQDSGARRALGCPKTGSDFTGPVRCCWKRWWTLSRNLVPRCQLDLSGADHGSGPHGSATPSPRSSHQRHLRVPRWSAMPGNAYAAIPRGKQIRIILHWVSAMSVQPSGVPSSWKTDKIRAELREWRKRLLDINQSNPLLGLNRSRVSKLQKPRSRRAFFQAGFEGSQASDAVRSPHARRSRSWTPFRRRARRRGMADRSR